MPISKIDQVCFLFARDAMSRSELYTINNTTSSNPHAISNVLVSSVTLKDTAAGGVGVKLAVGTGVDEGMGVSLGTGVAVRLGVMVSVAVRVGRVVRVALGVGDRLAVAACVAVPVGVMLDGVAFSVGCVAAGVDVGMAVG